MIIAVSGKGGTGKTLVSSLIIRSLSNKGKEILAIDADPDSNLPEALGVDVERTVGDIREELKQSIKDEDITPGMDKWSLLEYKIIRSIVETPKFDLLVMGRPEGSGCYCAVNTMLRKIIETLSSNYEMIVIDTEAGLEHLSRRTTQNVDIMLVVTDPSKKSILTAKRIEELADELEIKFKKIFLVLNRVIPKNEGELLKKINEMGLEVIGIIHEDENVTKYDMEGKPLIDLPKDSDSVVATLKITEKILNLSEDVGLWKK